MPALKTLVRGAAAVRPYARLTSQAAEPTALGVGVLQVDAAADRLAEVLGVPLGAPGPGEGLLVHAAIAGGDVQASGPPLAAHRRAGGRSLALLVGEPGLEARYLAVDGLGMSNLAHVPSLDGDGATAARAAVAEALGDELAATASRIPQMRGVAAALIIRRASRRAAAVAAASIVPGATMPVLTLLQARMVIDLARVHDRPLSTERALEIGAVVAAGFGWRALARGALLVVPGPAFALRGGVALAATRAVGEAADSWLREGGDAATAPLSGLRSRIEDAVRRVRKGEGP